MNAFLWLLIGAVLGAVGLYLGGSYIAWRSWYATYCGTCQEVYNRATRENVCPHGRRRRQP